MTRALNKLVDQPRDVNMREPTRADVKALFEQASVGGTTRAELQKLRTLVRHHGDGWEGPVKDDFIARLAKARPAITPTRAKKIGAPAAEDLSARFKTMSVPLHQDNDWHLADLVPLAERYEFKLLLQIGNGVTIAGVLRNLMRDTGKSPEELNRVIDAVRTRSWHSPWGEDPKIATLAGPVRMMIAPSVSQRSYRLGKRFTSRDDIHPYSKGNSFHGAVALFGESAHAKKMARALNQSQQTAIAYLEGGNVLAGTTTDGAPYCLVGNDSVVISAFHFDETGAIAEHRIQTMRERMEQSGAFTAELVAQTATKLTMARTGKWLESDEPSPEKAADAKRFLALMEVTKEVIAQSLSLPLSRVVFLTQTDFHIDVELRPLAQGEVLVNHPRAGLALVDRALRDPNAKPWERRELKQMRAKLVRDLEQHGHLHDRVIDELTAAGLTAIPAPGTFASKTRHANFLNAVPGVSKAGETFYITNATSIAPLARAAEAYFLQQGVDHVHFVGARGGGPTTLSGAEIALSNHGGIDCREVHYAGTDKAYEDVIDKFLASPLNIQRLIKSNANALAR